MPSPTETVPMEVPERTADQTTLSPTSFNRFAHYITAELGIKMPDSKLTMVQSRLMRRVRELRIQSVEQYAGFFFSSEGVGEREHFINAITTNKTDFFREPRHFEFLQERVLPAVRCETSHAARFKAWSAGCSSGEEPYTLAMVLADFRRNNPGFEFVILGTDISTKVLSTARGAVYQHSQVLPVPPNYRGRYLLSGRSHVQGQVRIVPDLRRRVSLHRLNLMDGDYGIRDVFDVVFFRNVMIYFDRGTQEAVINKICRHLAPGGYLFVGHSESLAGLNIPVKAVETAVYRKPLG